MIKTRRDMKHYISADMKRMPIPHPFLSALSFSEGWSVRRYLVVLRHLEYHMNVFSKYKKASESNRFKTSTRIILMGGAIYQLVVYLIFFIIWRRKSLITGIQVYPNTCGPGLVITHRCFVHVDNITTIGANCSILPMVLFGKNKPGKIVVGNNVTFGCGVTVLAPCKIGNNVYIGAGAVVNRDIPDNCIVAGVPAKIIRVNNPIDDKKYKDE